MNHAGVPGTNGHAGRSGRVPAWGGAVITMMPLARYFVFVGGGLMAVLIAFDLFSPKAAADIGAQSAAVVDKSTLRIRSDQKWPERVVFDTTQPAAAPRAAEPVQVQAALPGPAPAPEFTAGARVRETFAQFVPAEPKKPEATTAKKRKVAKTTTGQPHQPLQFAQQRGLFGTSTW